MTGRTLGEQFNQDGQIGPSQRMKSTALVGLIVHGLLAILHLVTGLLATLWTVGALWTVWATLLALAVEQRHRRPLLVAIVPVIDLALWVLGVWLDSAITR